MTHNLHILGNEEIALIFEQACDTLIAEGLPKPTHAPELKSTRLTFYECAGIK